MIEQIIVVIIFVLSVLLIAWVISKGNCGSCPIKKSKNPFCCSGGKDNH